MLGIKRRHIWIKFTQIRPNEINGKLKILTQESNLLWADSRIGIPYYKQKTNRSFATYCITYVHAALNNSLLFIIIIINIIIIISYCFHFWSIGHP
jgi:hypothetical protein